ncbi:MAG: flagellar basal-body MS-ring/collar protein FliF [Acidimicrobiales bacterium]
MALVAAADVDRWKSSARRFADGFTPGQKVVTVVAIVAAVVGGMVFMSLSGKPTYSPLFTNLQPSDAAAITAKLASDKVPYQLENGGSTILVPQNEVDQERINMASAGLPASSANVGLGILDKEGITTSQLTQQADYLRALQGELQQTIGAINGVTGVQVNLAMPANNTFALNNTSPTGASVLVDTAPGQTLSGGEVQAIVHLVASSVPNLSASEVTVADNNGDLLAGPGVDTSAGSNNNATSAFDTAQQAKIAAYLQSVLGPNNADIQVNAQLDFNKVSTTTNGFQLGANNTPVTVPTQTQTSTQTATGGAAGTGANGGGVLGTTTAPAGTGTGTGNYTNSSSSTQYAAGTVTQTSQTAPGGVTRQSIAVLVNAKSMPKGVSLATLQQGVAAAAGLDTARGDTLVMSAVPFSTAAQQAANKAAAVAAAAQSKAKLSSMVRTAVVALAILAVLFLLWRSAKKNRVPRRTPVVLPQQLAQPVEPPSPALDATTQVPAVGVMPHRAPELNDAVSNFIDSQPDEVAALLRAWTKERPTGGAPASVGRA